MANQVNIHRGPWESDPDTTKEKCPALLFMESYSKAVDSSTRSSIPWSKFYSEMAIYHDTKGGALIGGYSIWEKIKNLLHPFSHIYNEPVEIRVLPCDVVAGRQIVYGEFLTHFLLRGDLEGEEILVPKFGVWTLGYEEEEEEREGDNEGETDGEGEKGEGRVDSIIGKGKGGGLRIVDVKQFYDNAVIGRVQNLSSQEEEDMTQRKLTSEVEGIDD